MASYVIQCSDCAHQISGTEAKCKAFPDGIPKDVIVGNIRHDRILPGQTGDYVWMKKCETPEVFGKWETHPNSFIVIKKEDLDKYE